MKKLNCWLSGFLLAAALEEIMRHDAMYWRVAISIVTCAFCAAVGFSRDDK